MNDPIILSQKIALPYRYTAGPMHRAGLHGLATGRLVGSRCASCPFVTVPARPFCPSCSATMAEEVELPATGTLRSWTSGRGAAGAVGRIQIDGADNLMLHRLVAGDEWTAGMRVEAVWADDPEPEITALAGFRPV